MGCVKYMTRAEYETMQTEIEQLRAEVLKWQVEAGKFGPGMEAMEDLNSELTEALQRIVQWSEAYPIDIFPEPDLVKARELLAAGGITIDAISAHCMRHAVEGVGKIAREALK